MTRLRITLRVLLPVVILVAGFGLMRLLAGMRPVVETKPPTALVPLVDVVEARPEDVRLWVETHGSVVPRTETRILSEISGRILGVAPVLVNGGFFEAGEVLVRIDPTDYELAAARAEAEVARARRVLAQEEADALVARREWDRREGERPTPLVLHEPQVAEARSAVEAAQAMLQKARRDVERCEVRAPFTGRVRRENVDEGQFVPAGQELAVVYSTDWAEVRLPLPDAELAHLEIPLRYRGDEDPASGPLVSLRARFAGAEHEWQGRILRTEGELDPRNRMVIAVARVSDPYGRGEDVERPPLTVGMFLEARIEGRLATDAVRLPRYALQDSGVVHVVDDDGRLRLRGVHVLQVTENEAIVSAGLDPGEQVVVSPLEDVVDGMQVEVREVLPR